VADAQLWAARRTMPDTAMALTHPATLGADLTQAPSGGEGVGAVTLAEAAAVHPAAAPLAVVTMLGDDVRAALEQQFQPEGSQPFVKLGVSKGLTYTTWYDAPAGTRIRDLRLNGVYVHPLQTYRVAVDAMSLTPAAGFPAIADAENRTPAGATDLSALVDWFGAFGTAAPDVVQRSIGITLPGTDQTFTTGEKIAVELSGLDFTTSEPGAGTAVVSIGGITAGTAAVDRTLVADDDRTGRATVAAVVPSGLRGELPLTVTTSTGTRISTPVTIERGGKQPSLTIAQPRKLVWKYPEPVWMVIRVISDGDTTGEVTLYVDGEYAGSSSIGSNGYSTVGIGYGSMKRGFHTLSATFSGNAETAPSGGPPLPILVR
jgi:5'-nucleotidase